MRKSEVETPLLSVVALMRSAGANPRITGNFIPSAGTLGGRYVIPVPV